MKRSLILVFVAGALLSWWLGPTLVPEKKKPGLSQLTNRVWQDKKANKPRDLTFRLALLDKARQRYGAVSHTSMYRMHVDLVRYRLKGKRLEIENAQDGGKAAFEAKVYECKRKAPKGFDLCLDLKRDGKKVTLYSKRSAGFGAADLPLRPAAVEAPPGEPMDRTPAWFERLAQ